MIYKDLELFNVMGFIYKIIHNESGKVYVGQTTQDINRRWKDHSKSQSNCTYLRNALKKYGTDAFKYEIICIVFDEDLDEFEADYIIRHNCIVPNGYNLKNGGNSIGGYHHQETKDKISKALKSGKARNNPVNMKPVIQSKDGVDLKQFFSITEAAKSLNASIIDISESINKRRISEICRGESKSQIYKEFEWRFGGEKKMVILKKHESKNHCQKKCVIQSEGGVDIRTFNSLSEAGKEINVHPSSITNACISRNLCKGFAWRTLIPAQVVDRRRVIESKNDIIINVYDNAHQASEIMKLEIKYIRKLCNYRLIRQGYDWKYEGDIRQPIEVIKKVKVIKQKIVKGKKESKVVKKVIQSKDEIDIKTYDSITLAAKELDVSHSVISKVCRGLQSVYKDFNFRYEGTEPIILQQKKVPIDMSYDTSHDSQKKEVIQSKDGIDIKKFRSISDAANAMNVSPSLISRVCSGRRPTAKGFVWRYATGIKPLVIPSNGRQNRQVIQSKDGIDIETFNSIGHAAREIGCDHSLISKVCRGVIKSSQGFNWRYHE
jgi:group I intron endonuclease